MGLNRVANLNAHGLSKFVGTTQTQVTRLTIGAAQLLGYLS